MPVAPAAGGLRLEGGEEDRTHPFVADVGRRDQVAEVSGFFQSLLANRAISITKGTALGTAVSLPEVLGQAESVMAIAANPSPLTLAAALYLCFFVPLVVASRLLEQRQGFAR